MAYYPTYCDTAVLSFSQIQFLVTIPTAPLRERSPSSFFQGVVTSDKGQLWWWEDIIIAQHDPIKITAHLSSLLIPSYTAVQ